MNVRLQHLISTYLLLCLGTTAMWLSEWDRIPPYPIVVALCAIAAYIFTDRLKWMQLPHFVSNCLGLLILFTVFRELWVGSEHSILALGHFLVYLQVVKFFRQKRPGDFLMMYVLSLLQVCIGCIVTPQLAFGVLLFLYAIVGVWSVVLFQLCRPEWSAEIHALRTPAPTLGLAAAFCRLLVAVAPITLLVFWLSPRASAVKFASIQSPVARESRLRTGFSGTVKLDEESGVQESADVVFTFKCTDRNGNPVIPSAYLLWRGVVSTFYMKSSWEPTKSIYLQSGRARRFPPAPPRDYRVMYDVTLLNPESEVLFGPESLVWAGCDRDVGVVLQQPEKKLRLRSGAVTLHEQVDEPIRYQAAVGSDDDPDFLDRSYRLVTQKNPELPIVEETAQQLTSDLSPDDVKGKIDRIMAYLNDGSQFSYTLDLDREDRNLDPVEDFLVNTKSGHCEYFASALALMLRSVGVSSRVITGFKGWDYNEEVGRYEVRQLHAHAWVEAYLPDEQRWQTLDPSPSEGREAAVAQARSAWYSWDEFQRRLSDWWSQYIVGYNNASQQELAASVWNRIRATGSTIWEKLRSYAADLRNPSSWTSEHASACLLFVVAAAVAWRLWKRLRTRRSHRRETVGNGHAPFPLYQEWMERLRRHGFVRRPHQTDHEFAQVVEQELSQRPVPEPLRQLPTAMAELYYAVRFGNVDGATLDLDHYASMMRQFDQT